MYNNPSLKSIFKGLLSNNKNDIEFFNLYKKNLVFAIE